jgi:hypothetical protein
LLFSVNIAIDEIKAKLLPAAESEEAPVAAPEEAPAVPEAAEAELPEEAPALTDRQMLALEAVAVKISESREASILQTELGELDRRYMPMLEDLGYINRVPEGNTFRITLTPLFNAFFEVTEEGIIEKSAAEEEFDKEVKEIQREIVIC